MIEVNSVFTKESVKEISRGKRLGNYILFPLVAALMVAGGIISISRGVKGMEFVGAIILFAAAPIVVFLAFYMSVKETKNNAKSFGVDRGDVVMNYKFSNTSVAITRVADGKTDREVLHFRDLYKVKRTKKFFLLFVNKDEMYYVPAKPQDFVSGSADELFKLFYDNKVILDY